MEYKRRLLRTFKVSVFALAVSAALLSACGNDQESGDNDTEDHDGTDDTDSAVVDGEMEIFTWWTAAGEADALNALLNVYRDLYPEIDVVNVSGVLGDGDAATAAIRDRLDNGEAPPDVMQVSAGNKDIDSWTNYDGHEDDNKLSPVDFIWDEEDWTADFPEKIKLLMSGTDDLLYGIPIGMHRFNTLITNKNLVPDPPTTYREFIELAQDIESKGGTPVVFCEDGWTLDIMLHSILASVDTDLYAQFYVQSLDTNSEAGEAFLRTGFERFLEILSYASPAAPTTSDKSCWINASEEIFNETAAMFFHPDWVKGYLTSKGFTPGIDFDSVSVFETEDVFRFNIDSFVLFKDASNMDNAVRFLRVAGSPEGQVAFNTVKGSTPINPNIDQQSALWDSIAESTKQHFDSATHRLWDLEYNNQNLGEIASQLYKGTITVEQAVSRF